MRILLILIAIGLVCGQTPAPRGVPPRNAAAGYEHHASDGKLSIGAMYMGRSFGVEGGALHDAGEFIVVEVGVFAGKSFDGAVRAGDFRLKLEDKKLTLLPTPPGLVANALRNRDLDPQRRRLIYGGGMGNGQVMVGMPRPQERFPGDPRPGRTQPRGTTTTREGDERDWDAAARSGLPEVAGSGARAGNLFFAYSCKMTKVKKIVLEYEGEAGRITLPLR
jgi:hypothetical protein